MLFICNFSKCLFLRRAVYDRLYANKLSSIKSFAHSLRSHQVPPFASIHSTCRWLLPPLHLQLINIPCPVKNDLPPQVHDRLPPSDTDTDTPRTCLPRRPRAHANCRPWVGSTPQVRLRLHTLHTCIPLLCVVSCFSVPLSPSLPPSPLYTYSRLDQPSLARPRARGKSPASPAPA